MCFLQVGIAEVEEDDDEDTNLPLVRCLVTQGASGLPACFRSPQNSLRLAVPLVSKMEPPGERDWLPDAAFPSPPEPTGQGDGAVETPQVPSTLAMVLRVQTFGCAAAGGVGPLRGGPHSVQRRLGAFPHRVPDRRFAGARHHGRGDRRRLPSVRGFSL